MSQFSYIPTKKVEDFMNQARQALQNEETIIRKRADVERTYTMELSQWQKQSRQLLENMTQESSEIKDFINRLLNAADIVVTKHVAIADNLTKKDGPVNRITEFKRQHFNTETFTNPLKKSNRSSILLLRSVIEDYGRVLTNCLQALDNVGNSEKKMKKYEYLLVNSVRDNKKLDMINTSQHLKKESESKVRSLLGKVDVCQAKLRVNCQKAEKAIRDGELKLLKYAEEISEFERERQSLVARNIKDYSDILKEIDCSKHVITEDEIEKLKEKTVNFYDDNALLQVVRETNFKEWLSELSLKEKEKVVDKKNDEESKEDVSDKESVDEFADEQMIEQQQHESSDEVVVISDRYYHLQRAWENPDCNQEMPECSNANEENLPDKELKKKKEKIKFPVAKPIDKKPQYDYDMFLASDALLKRNLGKENPLMMSDDNCSQNELAVSSDDDKRSVLSEDRVFKSDVKLQESFNYIDNKKECEEKTDEELKQHLAILHQNLNSVVVAVRDYHAQSPEQLSLCKGDKLRLRHIEKGSLFGEGWKLGGRRKEREQGTFPLCYVTPLKDIV